MSKILFFDIDGTLSIGKQVSKENINCLKALKDKGYLTFICTGRAPFYAQYLFNDLVSGYICCNGRYILYNGERLHGEAFTNKELNDYLHLFDELDAGYFLVSDHNSYVHNLNEQYLNETIHAYGKDHIITEYVNQPYYTFDLFYKDLKHRDKIIERLKDKIIFNDHGGHGSGDCSTIGFDKGNGIEYCIQYFNIDINDTYAFGDGYNDQAMFRVVHNKIAMGNAVDVLKEKATYITTNCDAHGIKNALLHYHLIDE